MALDTPLTSMGTEAEAVWGFTRDGIPIWMGSFGGDFFNYSDLNYSLSQANGSTSILRFDLQDNVWNTTETHARVIEGAQSTYTLLVPRMEVGPNPMGVRFSTFKAEGPRQSGSVSSMTHPALSENFIPAGDFGTYTFISQFALDEALEQALSSIGSLAAPTPPPTATSAPTPEPSATPAPTPAGEATATDADGETDDDGGGGLNLAWVGLGLGALIMFGGAYLLFFDKSSIAVVAEREHDAGAANRAARAANCDETRDRHVDIGLFEQS